MLRRMLNGLGKRLARYPSQPSKNYEPLSTHGFERLVKVLRAGDVVLVEGNRRISTTIKFLTHSTWSHAALYVDSALGSGNGGNNAAVSIEADLERGVIAVPLEKYAGLHTRICRPVGLTELDRRRVIDFAVSRRGEIYDLKNVIDLMRYLLPTPWVPIHWRRRMLALGSGDPTRVICSTLIALAFQSVRYPILPQVTDCAFTGDTQHRNAWVTEIMHIRDSSLYAPRDFDLSPFFQIIKPTLESGFDYRAAVWA